MPAREEKLVLCNATLIGGALELTPEQMKALLAIAGFDVEEDLGPAELNHRYLARRRDGLQIAGGGFR